MRLNINSKSKFDSNLVIQSTQTHEKLKFVPPTFPPCFSKDKPGPHHNNHFPETPLLGQTGHMWHPCLENCIRFVIQKITRLSIAFILLSSRKPTS